MIQEIADNSIQGSGDRFVLGNWISHGDGYVADARANGGVWYESHPDIYNKLEELYGKGDPRIDQTLWQINEAALQKQIDKRIDFDYSLMSIKNIGEYEVEIKYVKLLESGNVTDVLKRLGRKEGDALPARLKEIQLLLDIGYTPNYDNGAHVIHWTLEP